MGCWGLAPPLDAACAGQDDGFLPSMICFGCVSHIYPTLVLVGVLFIR
jgi:hypothetical protein